MSDENFTSNDSDTDLLVNISNVQLELLKLSQGIFYVVSSIMAIICSIFVIVIITRHKALHSKDFYLLAGLAGNSYSFFK